MSLGKNKFINDRDILNPFFYRLALCFYQQSYIKSVLEQYKGSEEIEKMRRDVYEFYMKKLSKLRRHSQIELEQHDPDIDGLLMDTFKEMKKILDSRHPRDIKWEDHTILDGYDDMLYMISSLPFKTLLIETIRDIDKTICSHNSSFPSWKIFAVNDGNENYAEIKLSFEGPSQVNQPNENKVDENTNNDDNCRNDNVE
ncbi:Hypothetical protein SRAE_X000144600 [Strongyloides ratti]|uniref:Uncharacterized protein n=1 Tax=Strongyloides ratti TaxID=34506 RepID=A0A090KV44_STRRB|nr:Hypothetical protein SRAE_X000144600 [Strongyloides ratti]CEF59700.1 Hypothetical protein SRAE_X000144600 [Strongyloides ratti]